MELWWSQQPKDRQPGLWVDVCVFDYKHCIGGRFRKRVGRIFKLGSQRYNWCMIESSVSDVFTKDWQNETLLAEGSAASEQEAREQCELAYKTQCKPRLQLCPDCHGLAGMGIRMKNPCPTCDRGLVPTEDIAAETDGDDCDHRAP